MHIYILLFLTCDLLWPSVTPPPKHFRQGSKRPQHRVWPFHPKTHTETHTTTHKHRLPNAKRAGLFTPINIPSEEEGKRILSLHLLGLMFARRWLLPQFFLSTRGCRQTKSSLRDIFLLHRAPVKRAISPHTVCVCVACLHVTACWPGASLSSPRLFGFIKPCDSCKSPHLLSRIVLMVGGHRQVTACMSVTLTRFPINTLWTDSTPKGCNPWSACVKEPF